MSDVCPDGLIKHVWRNAECIRCRAERPHRGIARGGTMCTDNDCWCFDPVQNPWHDSNQAQSAAQPAADTIAKPQGFPTSNPQCWEFDRYRNGRLMAEGIRITREKSLEMALQAATALADRGDVLVLMSSAETAAELAKVDELLQTMIVSSQVYVEADGTITGYKIRTGALHKLVGLRPNLFFPQNLPLAVSREIQKAYDDFVAANPNGCICRSEHGDGTEPTCPYKPEQAETPPPASRGPTSVYRDHLENRASSMPGCDCAACESRRFAEKTPAPRADCPHNECNRSPVCGEHCREPL